MDQALTIHCRMYDILVVGITGSSRKLARERVQIYIDTRAREMHASHAQFIESSNQESTLAAARALAGLIASGGLRARFTSAFRSSIHQRETEQ